MINIKLPVKWLWIVYECVSLVMWESWPLFKRHWNYYIFLLFLDECGLYFGNCCLSGPSHTWCIPFPCADNHIRGDHIGSGATAESWLACGSHWRGSSTEKPQLQVAARAVVLWRGMYWVVTAASQFGLYVKVSYLRNRACIPACLPPGNLFKVVKLDFLSYFKALESPLKYFSLWKPWKVNDMVLDISEIMISFQFDPWYK